MLREGPIPQSLQGLLEYAVGVLFVAAPFLFGFTDAGMATAASIVLGVVFLVIAATSQSPTGLVKQLPPVVHVLFDVVMALLLIAAPFVLGFSDYAAPRNLFLISGVVWLLVTIGSRYGKRSRPVVPPAGALRPTPPGGWPPAPSIGGQSSAGPPTMAPTIGQPPTDASAGRSPTGPPSPNLSSQPTSQPGVLRSDHGELGGGQRPR